MTVKMARRSTDTIFARNPGTKWHYCTERDGAIKGMCKFRGAASVKTSQDYEKPVTEVCKNCRKYAFYWGWR